MTHSRVPPHFVHMYAPLPAASIWSRFASVHGVRWCFLKIVGLGVCAFEAACVGCSASTASINSLYTILNLVKVTKFSGGRSLGAIGWQRIRRNAPIHVAISSNSLAVHVQFVSERSRAAAASRACSCSLGPGHPSARWRGDRG